MISSKTPIYLLLMMIQMDKASACATRCVDGVLVLNKPQGMTSHTALQTIKRLFGAEKAGHTGTLDPMATGMLPLCFGEATKFSQFLLESHKTYEATGTLGASTTTGDAWGEIVSLSKKTTCSQDELNQTLSKFIGIIEQVPPMFSALKHKGKPLYEYARAGEIIPRSARQVEVYELKLLTFDGQHFKICARVSKGTYIRTLIEDIAIAMGSQGHMSQLHRISTAGFEQSAMYDIDTLTHMTQAARLASLLPVERTVTGLPALKVSEMDKILLYQGQVIAQAESPLNAPEQVALYDEQGHFFGVGTRDPDGKLKSKRLRRAE